MDGRRPSQGGALARPGQHTDEVLAAIGFAAGEIAALRERKAVG
jgi:crotonobetainyl-CoA:carnitine CoA-transferase CaiB-like acyl-CoA transferase